jgi:hypothetical protein
VPCVLRILMLEQQLHTYFICCVISHLLLYSWWNPQITSSSLHCLENAPNRITHLSHVSSISQQFSENNAASQTIQVCCPCSTLSTRKYTETEYPNQSIARTKSEGYQSEKCTKHHKTIIRHAGSPCGGV